MQKRFNQSGFTIIEVTCAIVMLTIGLMGVAGMQAKSIQGNAFAYSFNEGSNLAQEWMEWMTNYLNQPDQDNLLFNGKLQKNSFIRLSNFDTDQGDDSATEIDIPSNTVDLLTLLAENGLQDAEGNNFTADQIPSVPGRNCRMTWRITANKPVENTTTVEIRTSITNAFARDKRNAIRFIISTNL